MAADKTKQTVWQRICAALYELDAAFDPAVSVEERLATLEARVDALECASHRKASRKPME
ncbi:hypothetical protein OVA07_09950 [Novosphingobium sp. SL115]|uniref:hypothetical protein n=1 Tax=Novosphingobium sp. SL115 TaxID=2995150 RepID=UPI002273CE3B|nr:hypothetical protein [Novosphingobium sp. SL115]MCY1671331.1 hypothetical protein [Novosphingobium sp. SL115]